MKLHVSLTPPESLTRELTAIRTIELLHLSFDCHTKILEAWSAAVNVKQKTVAIGTHRFDEKNHYLGPTGVWWSYPGVGSCTLGLRSEGTDEVCVVVVIRHAGNDTELGAFRPFVVRGKFVIGWSTRQGRLVSAVASP